VSSQHRFADIFRGNKSKKKKGQQKKIILPAEKRLVKKVAKSLI
jgi:hypothetical protein